MQVYLERFPQLVGRTFGSIAFQLPDGIPFGIVNHFRCAAARSWRIVLCCYMESVLTTLSSLCEHESLHIA